jgi:vacuolar-type H+-ATPase subunit E/Vma4
MTEVNGNNNNGSSLLIEMITKGLEETKNIAQNIQNENQSNALVLTTLRTEVNVLRQQADWLIKAVRDETGDRSLMARVLILESDVKNLDEWLDDQKKKEDAKTNHLDSIVSEEHKGKWQLKIALATGCLGFVATIVTALLSFFLKK